MKPAAPLAATLCRTSPTEWGVVHANKVVYVGSHEQAKRIMKDMNEPTLNTKQTKFAAMRKR